MFHTFSVDSQTGDLLVSAKVYSDFGSHIPLIRSFSLGDNWPPEYPLFPGEAIKYHFLFYFFIGIVERIGLRLDLALNLISGLGFLSFLLMILLIAKKLFGTICVGVLSVLFVLFNGSFSFLDFFKNRNLSPNLFNELITNSVFPSFGPWNGSVISAFWNLNIYTNQRHLGLSYAICLLSIYLLNLPRRNSLLLGFLFGSLLLLNQAGFLVVMIFIFHRLVVDRTIIKIIPTMFLGLIPWLFLYLLLIGRVNYFPVFKLGYLIKEGGGVVGVLLYWFLNLGLHIFLIPLGIIFAPKKLRSFGIPILLLFLIPNFFQLSVDMINNHKLLNFFMIFGSLFSAYFVVLIWKKSIYGKAISIGIIPFMVLGGVVDFFPLKNDHFIRISDYQNNSDINYILKNTSPDAVFLNDRWFYNPVSLAGRKIFNGYPYFTWSYGYDNIQRENITVEIYDSKSVYSACDLLQSNKISYVQTNYQPEDFLKYTNRGWISKMKPEYDNSISGIRIYSVSNICKNI